MITPSYSRRDGHIGAYCLALLVLGLLLSVAHRAFGQQAPTPAGVVADTDTSAVGEVASDEGRADLSVQMIKLALPEQLEIRVLVEYVSQRLDVNIHYDDSTAKKEITLLAPAMIPKDSLLDLLQSVLKMSGLALVDAEEAGWKKIVPLGEVHSVVGLQRDPGALAEASASVIVSQVFVLENITTTSADKTIQAFLSKPGGSVITRPEMNMLIITDYAGVLRRVAGLIEIIDRPGDETMIEFIPVKYVAAAQLAGQVSDLLKQEQSLASPEAQAARDRTIVTHEQRTNQLILISAGPAPAEVLRLIESLDVPSDAVTRRYQLQYISPTRIDQLARMLADTGEIPEQYKSAVDVESGLFVLTAPLRVHEQVQSLCEQLDVADAAGVQSHIQFYKLMNTTAESVLGTISSMQGEGFDLTAMAMAASARNSQAGEEFTGPNNPPPPVGEPLPEPPAYVPDASDDVAPGQSTSLRPPLTTTANDAVITADPNTNTIIVVAPPPVQRLYEKLIAVLDKRQPQVLIEVTLVTIDTSHGRSLGVEISRRHDTSDEKYELTFSAFGLSEIDQGTGILTLTPGIGFNGVMVSADTLNIVIRALVTDGDATVLSAPKVLVNDNTTATLSSVAEAPFASINASDTVSTTSFGGYASAGTTISVTPHISEDDYLQLEYTITLNSFSGGGEGNLPPPRQTNTLSSQITIPDGYAIVVGGLTRKDTSRTVSRVPWLGEWPIIEYLFSSRSNNESQSTLFAFIRPIILRDDEFEDLKYLSARDLRAARLPPNFPTSEPIIMQ